MKLSWVNKLVSIIVIVIIGISLFYSTRKVMPYSRDNLFPNYHKYEGFSPLDYSSSSKEGKVVDTYSSFLINNPNFECKKVHGFDGLYCKPYVADMKLDIFSDSDGGLDCTGSELSNSKGSLCLNKNQRAMLSTRGGNATGPSHEIGH